MAYFKTSHHDDRQNMTVSFLSLPLEIRSEIYFLVLRPDCKMKSNRYCEKRHQHLEGARGCTNLLLLCSQIYLEAIEMLHSQEHSLSVTGSGMQMFRYGKDYPRPHEFCVYKKTSKCYLPPPIAELEFTRFRKLHLTLLVPDRNVLENIKNRNGNVARNMNRVANAISKMTNLQYVRLSVDNKGFTRWWHWEAHKGRMDALRGLLKAIILKRVVLVFGSSLAPDGQRDVYDDRLLPEIRQLAVRLAKRACVPVQMEEDMDLKTTVGALSFSSTSITSLMDDVNIYPEPEPKRVQGSLGWIYSDDEQHEDCEDSENLTDQLSQAKLEVRLAIATEGVAGILDEDYKPFKTSPSGYQLVPECRYCLNVFRSQAELSKHLKQHRTHRIPYRYRKENAVRNPTPHDRKCWTCGAGYTSLEYLNYHLDNHGHRRYGIIPRYCEDNDAYDLYWQRWFDEKGWL